MQIWRTQSRWSSSGSGVIDLRIMSDWCSRGRNKQMWQVRSLCSRLSWEEKKKETCIISLWGTPSEEVDGVHWWTIYWLLVDCKLGHDPWYGSPTIDLFSYFVIIVKCAMFPGTRVHQKFLLCLESFYWLGYYPKYGSPTRFLRWVIIMVGSFSWEPNKFWVIIMIGSWSLVWEPWNFFVILKSIASEIEEGISEPWRRQPTHSRIDLMSWSFRGRRRTHPQRELVTGWTLWH